MVAAWSYLSFRRLVAERGASFIPRRGLRPEIPVLPARSRNAAAVIDTGKTGKIILLE